MSAVWYWWRGGHGRSARSTAATAVVVGLLGAVVLASLAGARRTASAYSRYLRGINASNVWVNTPGPDFSRIAKIAALPGVRSSVAYVGLNAEPVVHGHEDDSFLTDGVFGSVDGMAFTQDRMTVLKGRLPSLGAADEVALTPSVASLFGVGVGGTVAYDFYTENLNTGATIPAGRIDYRVAGLVSVPPVLVDEVDVTQGAVLPPAATTPRLATTQFIWSGLQLTRGRAGIPALQAELAKLSAADGESALLKRLDQIHDQVQRSIRPEAVALGVFGLVALLALLVIDVQASTRLSARWGPDRDVLRQLGATRLQLAIGSAIDGFLATIAGVVLAVVGAAALSPLAPIGTVRPYDPSHGIHLDLTVLLGGGAVMFALLGAVLGAVAWRAARHLRASSVGRPSAIVGATASSGLGVPAVMGARFALERTRGAGGAPVRAALFGSVAAVVAIVTALVFGASLDALVSHPLRYGWAWDRLLVAEGGYGNLAGPATNWHGPAVGDLDSASPPDGPAGGVLTLMAQQRGVTGWSLMGYAQLTVDGLAVPVVGLDREEGSVEPPTADGRPLGGPDEIELGASTMRQLDKRIGQTVEVSPGGSATGKSAPTTRLTIVGTATFPAVGVVEATHPSLGTGAMIEEDTLLAIALPGSNCSAAEASYAATACPSSIALDVAPGVNGHAIASRIAAAYPDGTPGGTYEQVRVRGAQISGYAEMGSDPVVLAALLVLGALATLAFTLIAGVRQRRRELALLKTFGFTRRQLRATVAWQATFIILSAVVIGVPLGVAAGRLLWLRFAGSLGVVPTAAVPAIAITLTSLGLLIAGNLVAAGPGALAARTPAATALRAE